jgi:hypothetical protein
MAATTGIINGTDFLVYIEGVAIAHSPSCTLNLTSATRDTSSKTSAGVTNREYGKRDWSVNGDGLYQFTTSHGFSSLFSLYKNRTKVTVRISTETADNKYYEGEALLTSLSATFPKEENSTFTFTFEADGDITEYTGT